MSVPDFQNFYNIVGEVTSVSGKEITVKIAAPDTIKPYLYPLYITGGRYIDNYVGGEIIEFRLKGANPENINLNSNFVDFGVIAKWRAPDGRIHDVSTFVRRFGNVITDKFGIYDLNYVLDFVEHNAVINREVIVEEPDWLKHNATPAPYLDKPIFKQFVDRLYDVFYELNWKIDQTRFGFDTTRKQVPQWTSDFSISGLINYFEGDAVDTDDNKIFFDAHTYVKFDTVELDAQGNTLPTGLLEQSYLILSATRNSIVLSVDGVNPINITGPGSGEIKITKIDTKVSLTGWVYELAYPENTIIEEPGTPRFEWDSEVPYIIGDIVEFGGVFYYSQINNNIARTPMAGDVNDPWKISSWNPLYRQQRIGRLEDDISLSLAHSIGIPQWMYNGLLKSLSDKKTVIEIFKLIKELRGTEDGFLSFLKIAQEGFTGAFELTRPDYREWTNKGIYFPGTQVTYGSQLWECLLFNQTSLPSLTNPNWKLINFDVASDDLYIARTFPEDVRFISPDYYQIAGTVGLNTGILIKDQVKSNWDATVTYNQGDSIYGVDGRSIYYSITNGNIGNDPALEIDSKNSPINWSLAYSIAFQDGNNGFYTIQIGSLGLGLSNTDREVSDVLSLIGNTLEFFIPDYVTAAVELSIPVGSTETLIYPSLTTQDITDPQPSNIHDIKSPVVVFKYEKESILEIPPEGHIVWNAESSMDLADTWYLRIHKQNYDGVLVGNIIEDYLKISGEIFIEYLNGITRGSQRYRISDSVIDTGDYFHIPVKLISATGPTFQGAQVLTVSFLEKSQEVPVPRTYMPVSDNTNNTITIPGDYSERYKTMSMFTLIDIETEVKYGTFSVVDITVVGSTESAETIFTTDNSQTIVVPIGIKLYMIPAQDNYIIIGINQGSKTFTLRGVISGFENMFNNIAGILALEVYISNENAGIYTIVSAVANGSDVDVTVAEAIPSDIIDGVAGLVQP